MTKPVKISTPALVLSDQDKKFLDLLAKIHVGKVIREYGSKGTKRK